MPEQGVPRRTRTTSLACSGGIRHRPARPRDRRSPRQPSRTRTARARPQESRQELSGRQRRSPCPSLPLPLPGRRGLRPPGRKGTSRATGPAGKSVPRPALKVRGNPEPGSTWVGPVTGAHARDPSARVCSVGQETSRPPLGRGRTGGTPHPPAPHGHRSRGEA